MRLPGLLALLLIADTALAQPDLVHYSKVPEWPKPFCLLDGTVEKFVRQ